MGTPSPRSLPLAVWVLAGLLLGLPWTVGGRSPAGQASLLLLLILAGLLGLFPPGREPRLRPSLFLLLAAIVVMAAAARSIYPDRTIQSLLLLLAYLLAGSLAAHGARETPWAEDVLLAAILVSGGLVAGAGILQLLGGQGGFYAGVLTGPFGYPNAAAGFLLLAAGAALTVFRGGRGRALRYAALAAGSLALLGLLLTRSRGALLAAAVGLAVWAVVTRAAWWPPRRWWVLVAGLAVLAALALSAPQVVALVSRLRGMGGDGGGDTSLLWRLQILQWTWAMVRDHPWAGVGPGAFPVALNRYQAIPYVSGENPHNLYLEVAAEYGLPAGLLLLLALGGLVGRLGALIARTPANTPTRRRLGPLFATLTAFALHSAVDLDWSFPAIAAAAATLVGLASAPFGKPPSRRLRPAQLWRAGLLLVLSAAAVLGIARYAASSFLSAGRAGLAAGDLPVARRDLTWALRLNPLSFPVRHWLAWAHLQSGDPQAALAVAERAVALAPADANGWYLAGEIALAAGRGDAAVTHFRSAVERAPSSQLRFHAGLVHSLAGAGREVEARWRYERAIAIFTPERVLEREARCLAPGDRYLLAGMSRLAAHLYAGAGDRQREDTAANVARNLAQPDPRGICLTYGRPGQVSPEEAVASFWRALAERGWAGAEPFLAPELRTSRPARQPGGQEEPAPLPGARVVWIAALQGGERRVSLRYEVEMESPAGSLRRRCVGTDLTFIQDGWFIERLPVVGSEPCRPGLWQ